MNYMNFFIEVLHCIKHDLLMAVDYVIYCILILPIILGVRLLLHRRFSRIKPIEFIFLLYLIGVVSITLLSREPGTRIGIDLQLFQTLNRTPQSFAYFFENILLFIPFGILAPCTTRKFSSFLFCIGTGFLFSLGIELIQLVTKSGYCQLDDLLMNTLGTMIGYFIYNCGAYLFKIIKYRNL